MAFWSRTPALLAALAAASCGTGDPDPAYWQPTGDLGGLSTPVPKPKPPSTVPEGPAISITFTSISQSGQYAPDTYTVVWVEDAAGQYVRTLMAAIGIYGVREVEDWSTIRAGVDDKQLIDVISSSSVLYGTHTAYWEMTDYGGFEADPGMYRVVIQVTDRDDADEAELRFDLPYEPGAQDFPVPSTDEFRDISVAYPTEAMGVVP